MQEEQQREITRSFERFSERVVVLEDMTQEVQDIVQQVKEESQKRLQNLLAMAHEWVEQYDRVFGRAG